MTRTRKNVLSVLALLLALSLGVGLASCGGKDTEPTYGYGEEGTYYYSASEDTDYLLTLGGGSFILETGTSGYTGTYEYSEGIVTFYEEGEESGTGYTTEGGFSLTYGGKTYAFLRYEYYTVSFVDGGTTISTQSVLNGKTAQNPGDAEKDGYVFLGWYADSSYTTRYEFNTAVTGNTTIYARFVEMSGVTEYTVTYDYTGETTETINGVVYNLPEPERAGYTFLGWWVSATNQADELTYRYTDETLCEDTTLYAFWVEGSSYMGASVYDDRIAWENYGAAVTEIILRDENGVQVDRFEIQSTNGSYSYDFSSLPAGKYTLVIQGGGIDETLTYVSHALARVSNFTVISGSILMYDPVENAERYYITIDCGNPSHDHTMIDNGTSLYYDFSSCEMPAEGITFVVYAEAEGYYSSVSSEYNYFLGLDKAEVTAEGNEISWDAVLYAQEYEVYIDGVLVATTSGTSWSLAEYGTGTYEIAVKPVTKGYYSELSEIFSYTKTTLAAPRITGIENYVISWSEVEGATGYKINIGGTETTVEAGITSLYLTDENYIEGLDSYEISVKALAEDTANDSPYGEAITVTGTDVGSTVSYYDGTVTWQYSLSASEYRITVNEGDETVVFGKNSSPVILTRSGNNEIRIYFVDADDNVYGTASINVYAYAIVFDARGGTAYTDGEVVDTIYAAKGDTVVLPEADYGSATADFVGWYTLPDMTADPDAVDYMGDGVRYGGEGESFVFTGNSTIVLYACWLNPRMLVSLDPGMGTLTGDDGEYIEETYIRLNGEKYTIAVPEYYDAAYAFVGWYSGANGTGTRYTDENGEAYTAFSDESVTKLYAYWAKVLDITSARHNATSSEGDNVFSVAAGPDIAAVSEVTIPESYTVDGVEYTHGIINGTAFTNLTTLKTLNIPDTIVYILMTSNGYDAGTGVFAGTDLENLNVYATGEPSTTKEITYYSNDGVLFWVTSEGNVELIYYPHGRTDETYAIPETVCNENEYELQGLQEVPVVHDVNAIGASAFASHDEIVYMTIPETITVIGTNTFYNCANLKAVDFECEITELPDGMFYACSSLEEFEIPDTVTHIGASAFRECVMLDGIVIPGTVKEIGGYAFGYCDNLHYVTLMDGIETIDDRAFYFADLYSIELPDSVTSVGDYLFGFNYNLKTARISAGLESTGVHMFSHCEAMTGLEIPYGVKTIDQYLLYYCKSLEKLTLPESVTRIEDFAFREAYGIKEIYIPSSVTYIGTYAFFFCTALKGVTIPEGITEIPNSAFYSCTALEYIDLPSTLTTIGSSAFYSCYSLTTIIIPAKVENIGSSAFNCCYRLVEIYNLSDLNITAGSTSSSNGYIGRYAKVVHKSLDEESNIITRDGAVLIYDDAGYYYVLGCNDTTVNFELSEEVAAKTKEILPYAFYECEQLETAVIPDTVTTIGESAFYGCTNLRSVNIPYGVDELDGYVFYGCSSLESIDIPDTVTSIGAETFAGCTSLTSVVIPDKVSYLSIEAFGGCTNLVHVTIGSGVRDMDDTFYQCYKLVEVYNRSSYYTVTAGVSDYGYAGTYAKYVYTEGGQSHLSLDGDGFLTLYDDDGNYYLVGYYGDKTDITLPDTIGGHDYEIVSYAFYGREDLTSVTLGSGVTAIGDYAFYGCELIKEMRITSKVTYIGEYAFSGCASLATFTIPSGLTSIGRGALDGTAFYDDEDNWTDGMFYLGTMLMAVSDDVYGEVVVKDGTTAIAGNAFYYCSGITSVVIPSSMTEIGDYAFYYSTGLTSITLPDTITRIGDYAFYGCSVLTGITIPDGVTYIGDQAFRNCSSLSSVNIPGTVTYIGTYAFYGITSITSLDLKGTELTIGANAFYNCTGLRTLTLCFDYCDVGQYAFRGCTALATVDFTGSKCVDLGYGTFYGCTGLTSANIEGTRSMNGYTFYNCSALTSITIPGTVETMSTYEIRGCSKLTTVVIEEGVTYLGQYMIYQVTSLKTLYIPSTIESTGNYITYGCTGLTDVYLADGLTYIGYGWFYNASGLKSIDIPSSVTSIGQYAFYGCGFETFSIPDTVTEMGTYVFQNCTSLKSVEIPASLTTISNYTFRGCSALTEVIFPDTLTSIGTYVFYQCTSLETIVIPEGVTSIGNYCFYGCTNLKYVTLPESLTSIGTYCFQNCTSLVGISIPDGVKTINNYDFSGCSALEYIVIGSGVTTVNSNAFASCTSLTAIYFRGTESEWNVSSVNSSNNSAFTDAVVYYYSETEPTDDGNWWHYDEEGNPVAW